MSNSSSASWRISMTGFPRASLASSKPVTATAAALFLSFSEPGSPADPACRARNGTHPKAEPRALPALAPTESHHERSLIAVSEFGGRHERRRNPAAVARRPLRVAAVIPRNGVGPRARLGVENPQELSRKPRVLHRVERVARRRERACVRTPVHLVAADVDIRNAGLQRCGEVRFGRPARSEMIAVSLNIERPRPRVARRRAMPRRSQGRLGMSKRIHERGGDVSGACCAKIRSTAERRSARGFAGGNRAGGSGFEREEGESCRYARGPRSRHETMARTGGCCCARS